MKKRWAALMFCVVMLVNLATPMAAAEESVCFVAAGSHVLELSDETMPFVQDGYLYVSSSIFTGLVWRALDVGHIPANANQPLILYAGNDKSLMFEVGSGYAYDLTGKKFTPGAIEKDGSIFVPIYVVTQYFGLSQSIVNHVEHGKLLWVRKPGFGLSAKDFANAAVYSMEERYAQYLKNKRDAEHVGENLLPNPDDPENKRKLFLCLRADTLTGTVLDALDQQESQAAFFCDSAFLETQGDLLRRMVAVGHTVGLLVDAANPELTLEEQLSAGNEALYRATCTKTRLVFVENGGQEEVAAAEAAGYRCLEADLDRSEYRLQSLSNAETLIQRVAARREDRTTVWLNDTANAMGLRAFLTKAAEGARCLALTEVS